MRRLQKTIALILALIMSIATLETEALATRSASNSQAIGGEWESRYTKETNKYIDLDDKDFKLPDIIEEKEADERGYVRRVYEKENDLNTFVFQNQDGTNTMRVFDYPVKYIDKNGKTRDITTDIIKSDRGGYETKDNNIKTRFPKYLEDGITLTSEKVNVELTPCRKNSKSEHAANRISVKAIDDKTVFYYYDENTTLEYGLTYTGFKEDIVVNEYTGQTEYQFSLNTNGLRLVEEDSSYYLIDDNNQVQATVGDIIIFTADEANNTMGWMTSEVVKDREEYLLTIHVDEEYLRDKKTVYPIRIDPTIEINYDNNGAGAIQDVTVCSSTTQNGSSGSLYIGKRSGYGLCRVLMKFPTLNLSSVYSANYITSATVEIRDLMCETTAANIQCYVFNGNAWDESSATWSNTSPNSYTTFMSSNSVSYANGKKQASSHRYRFDITAAVKGWKSGSYTQSKGIMFKADSTVENAGTYNYKTFASYNRASYKPSLSIKYTPSVVLSITGNQVMVGQSKSITVKKYPSNLSLTWNSSDTNVVKVSSTGVVTGVSKGTATITAKYTDSATGKTSSASIVIPVYDSTGIANNQYYNIMNYHSGRYMSLEKESDSNNINVCTVPRTNVKKTQWKAEGQSDKSFQLVSKYSNSGRVVTASGYKTYIYADSNASNQKLEIYRVDSGTYQRMYLIKCGNNYLTETSDNCVYLNNKITEGSYWSFMMSEHGSASIFSMKYSGYDTSDNNKDFSTIIGGIKYNARGYIGESAQLAYENIRNDQIFMFRGHGRPGTIFFNGRNEEDLDEIAVNRDAFRGTNTRYISDYDNNELAELRCALYLGCETGVSVEGTQGQQTTFNILKETFDKGAHFVLGTTQVVKTAQGDNFLRGFLAGIDDGNSIELCIDIGLAEVGYVQLDDGSWGYYPITYIGDKKQILSN